MYKNSVSCYHHMIGQTGLITGLLAEKVTGYSLCRYGIMGLGAVCHTLNPRLFLADLEYIINHAEDKVLMLDLDLAGLIAKLRPKLPTVQHLIVLTDRKHMHKVVSTLQKPSFAFCGTARSSWQCALFRALHLALDMRKVAWLALAGSCKPDACSCRHETCFPSHFALALSHRQYRRAAH